MTSVSVFRPCFSPESRMILRASSPRPWNECGFVRGLNAPPRIQVRPEARDTFGHFFELLGRLDGARAGENGDLVGAGAQVGNGGYLRFAHTDGVSFMILRMVA